MQMIPVRIFFEKLGRAKYTSHLDTMRTMSRALKRSGLPVWYTQGFNPHLYSTFALPIALGYESLCESVDIRLTQELEPEEVRARLDAALPPGLRAVRAASPVMDPTEIAWARYRITLRYPTGTAAAMAAKLDTFVRQPVIEVVKKTKKGEKVLDIAPQSALLSLERQEDRLDLDLRLAAGNTLNINPTLYLKAFYHFSGLKPDGVRILRTNIYDKKMQDFL